MPKSIPKEHVFQDMVDLGLIDQSFVDIEKFNNVTCTDILDTYKRCLIFTKKENTKINYETCKYIRVFVNKCL